MEEPLSIVRKEVPEPRTSAAHRDEAEGITFYVYSLEALGCEFKTC
ncbi:MAG: hypothetical protein QG657_2061 [Acidobacteriota bacterium]|nr:hypothetical protein [Acidobacteriota bacterium]